VRLLRYVTEKDEPGHGVQVGESVYRLKDITTTEALESLETGSELWNQILEQTPVPLGSVSFLPPVENSGAFLDFYTFEQHVKTSRGKRGLKMVPEWYQFPVWYNGSTRCFSGNGTKVDFPEGETKKDFELE